MGVGLIFAAITVATAVGAFFLMSMQEQENQSDLQPATLDSFGHTQVKEGSVVPLIYGKVRTAGNMIWYGNLVTEPVEEKQQGGKGSGNKKKVITGYKYYLDVWQSIAIGEIEIISTYVADKPGDVPAASTIYNDGTDTVFPTQPGAFANAITGVAHVFYNQWFIGENVSFVPTIHFVVNKILPTTVNHANMTNGNNPAAIVYDLLTVEAGIPSGDIDLTSFNAAADYWYAKGYGLNLSFTSQQDVAKLIQQVLGYVDGVLYINVDGKFTLKAFDPAASVSRILKDPDFIEFTFSRGTYAETKNDFRAEYIDADDDFVKRTVQAKNPASINLANTQQESLDLTAFTDLDTASKRITEVMKQNSYPKSTIQFTTNLSHFTMARGEIIQVTFPDLQIANELFRVIQVDYTSIDDNKVGFRAEQFTEALFDPDQYLTAGGAIGSVVETAPIPLVYTRILELPYTTTFGSSPVFLVLAARERSETGFEVLYSNTGSDYTTAGLFGQFSQTGTLDEEYTDTTYTVDDEVGILYTPYREDPVFESQSRTDLFSSPRVAIIGNEIMAFQTVTPEGPNSIRLSGIIRGVLNTPVETHAVDARIWITRISVNNVLTGIVASLFYLKIVPFFADESADPSLIGDDIIATEYTAATPEQVARIHAERTGSSIDITWWPVSYFFPSTSAGMLPEIQNDQSPFEYDGDFRVQYAATDVYIDATTTTITSAGSVTVTISHRISGLIGEEKDIVVGVSDGDYYA